MGKTRLTEKQEAFLQAYMETRSPTEAYRRAFDTSKMKKETVSRRAMEMMKHPLIVAAVEKAQRKAMQKACVTLESHLADLARLRDAAEEDGQFSAAITAEISRGKAVGLYTERVKQELTGAGGGAIQNEIVVRFVEANHGD